MLRGAFMLAAALPAMTYAIPVQACDVSDKATEQALVSSDLPSCAGFDLVSPTDTPGFSLLGDCAAEIEIRCPGCTRQTVDGGGPSVRLRIPNEEGTHSFQITWHRAATSGELAASGALEIDITHHGVGDCNGCDCSSTHRVESQLSLTTFIILLCVLSPLGWRDGSPLRHVYRW